MNESYGTRYLTEREQLVMKRALRRSTRLVAAGLNRIEHNSGQFLMVVNEHGIKRPWPDAGPGWYVIRTCKCHMREPVTVAYPTRQDAERVMALLLNGAP